MKSGILSHLPMSKAYVHFSRGLRYEYLEGILTCIFKYILRYDISNNTSFPFIHSPSISPVFLIVWLRSFPWSTTSTVWVPTTPPLSSRWAGNFRRKLTASVRPSSIQGETLIFKVSITFCRFHMLPSEEALVVRWCFRNLC